MCSVSDFYHAKKKKGITFYDPIIFTDLVIYAGCFEWVTMLRSQMSFPIVATKILSNISLIISTATSVILHQIKKCSLPGNNKMFGVCSNEHLINDSHANSYFANMFFFHKCIRYQVGSVPQLMPLPWPVTDSGVISLISCTYPPLHG